MESRSREEEKKKTVTKEEVIAKLKDDGDFDNLRLHIIRKLKHNEDLRNSIVSIVRQSAALNRPGAENLRPRQLTDAIYDEVGSELMSKLSDGLWGVIRSDEGMKNEIAESVQSVYNKLAKPEKQGVAAPSTHPFLVQNNHKADSKDPVMAPSISGDNEVSDIEPQEPPGFSLSTNHQNHQEPIMHSGRTIEKQKQVKDVLKSGNVDNGAPFRSESENEQPGDGSDEDPEVPPGFG